MNAVEFSLHGLGAFYVFAGVVGARAAVTSSTLDRMIEVLERATDGRSAEGDHAGASSDKCDRGEADARRRRQGRASRARAAWMLAGAFAVLLAGASLLVRWDMAPWAFATAALLQAVYLFHVAPVYLDDADPIDAQGRRQTTNAFVLFSTVTAYVMWAGWRGALLAAGDVDPVLAGAVGLLGLGFIGHALWNFSKPPD